MDLRFWNKPKIASRRMIFEPLEERIVLDAAVDHIPHDNYLTGRILDIHSFASRLLDTYTHESAATSPNHALDVISAQAQTEMGASVTVDPDKGTLTIGPPTEHKPIQSADHQEVTKAITQDDGAKKVSHQEATGSGTQQESNKPVTQATTDTPASAESSTIASAVSDPSSKAAGHKVLDVVLVSKDVEHHDEIAKAAIKGAQVAVFDPATESLTSIASKIDLTAKNLGKKIEHLAFVTSGSQGHLKIGADDLTAKDIDAHKAEFRQIAKSLAPNARIDLYGCDIGAGQDGSALVSKIAKATHAKVWASNDITGNVPGANWDLEVKSSADAKPYLINSSALGSYQIHLAQPEPGPDPDFHVNKSPDGQYQNLNFNATDVDQPAPANVTFTVPVNPPEGTVTLNGNATEPAPGAYSQLFTFQSTNPNQNVTGPVTIDYTVQAWGFPDIGTDIAVAGPGYVNCAAFGNINGDAFPDIVLGTDVGAYTLINNGNGTFQPATLIPDTDPYNVQSVALGRIVPGHTVDDVILGVDGRNQWVRNNTVLPNNVVFGIVRNVGSAADTYDTRGIIVANLGNPNGNDVIEVNASGTGGVLYSHKATGPNWINAAGIPISAGVQPNMQSIAVADVDGAGGNDVILGVVGGQLRWHHGNNDGTIDPTVHAVGAVGDAYDTLSLAVGDLNADGSPDIVQGNANGEPARFYNNGGGGSFATAGDPIDNALWPSGIQIADMNADGNPDILFGNTFGPHMTFLGDGAGQFSTEGIPLNCDGGDAMAISVDPNWWPANAGPEVVVINDGLGSPYFDHNYPHRMYAWGIQQADGQYTLEIDPHNNPPVNTINGDPNVAGNVQWADAQTGTLVFTDANGNRINIAPFDPDAFNDNIEVFLNAENGYDMWLGPVIPGTVTVTGDGTPGITLSGPQGDISTAMDGLMYRSHRDRYGDVEGLSISTADLGHNESGTASPGTPGTPQFDHDVVKINVMVNYPDWGGDAWWNEEPHNHLNGQDISPTNPLVPVPTDGSGRVTFTGSTQVTVTDPDAEAATDTVVVTLLPTGGDIRLVSDNPSGVVLDPLGDHSTGGLRLTGTIDDINAALDGMIFRELPIQFGGPVVGNASLTVVTNDQGHNDHDHDGNDVVAPEDAWKTTTSTIPIDTSTVPITDPWWNLPPVNQIGGVNMVAPVTVAAGTDGTVAFDGLLAPSGHAGILTVWDDATIKRPTPDAPDNLFVAVTALGGDMMFADATIPTQGRVINGNLDQINAALNGMRFRAMPELPGAPIVPAGIIIESNDVGHNPPDYVGPQTTTSVINVSLAGIDRTLAWWNQPPVNSYNGEPIGPGNPAPLQMDASVGSLIFDGGTGIGHARLLSVVDDAEAKQPLPPVPHGADVQTTLSVADGILHLAPLPANVQLVPPTANDTNTVTLQGPPSAVSAALNNLAYVSINPEFVGNDLLVIHTNDLAHNPPDYVGALTDTDGIPIVVQPPRDANGNEFWGRWPRG